jgi:hypothetical protein
MTSNLKVLGLALVAMLTLGAMTAAAASAQQGVLTSDGPVTLHFEENEPATNARTIIGGKLEALGTLYTGHRLDKTPHEDLSKEGETTLTITPQYAQTNCVFTFLGVSRPCTITVNKCDYVLHIGQTTETTNTYGASTDIECPDNVAIDLDIYKVGTPDTDEAHTNSSNLFCTITVPEQTGLTGPHLTNDTANGDVDLIGTFTGVKYTRHGGAGCGPEQTFTNGQLHVDMTVTGTNEEGGATAIAISDE